MSVKTGGVLSVLMVLATGVSAPCFGYGEDELYERLVLAEADGQGQLGMALVARSVGNRAALIESGAVSPGTYNATSGRLSDVINGKGQYQPLSDGRIDNYFSASKRQQARDAIALSQDTGMLRQRLLANGHSPAEVDRLVSATGFRTHAAFDDPSQNYGRQSFGGHVFNSDRFSQDLAVSEAYDQSSVASRSPNGDPMGPVAGRFVPAHPNSFSAGRAGPIRGVVLHTIEGSARSGINWFQDPESKVSAHYVVDFNGAVTQMVADHDTAYHAKGANGATIGIEHAGYAEKNQWTDAQLLASAAITSRICRTYQIPIDRFHIRAHSETGTSDHPDPGVYFPWAKYLAMVQAGGMVFGGAGYGDTTLEASAFTGREAAKQAWSTRRGKDNAQRIIELSMERAMLMGGRGGNSPELRQVLAELVSRGGVPMAGTPDMYEAALTQGSSIHNGRSFEYGGATYGWEVRDGWPQPVLESGRSPEDLGNDTRSLWDALKELGYTDPATSAIVAGVLIDGPLRRERRAEENEDGRARPRQPRGGTGLGSWNRAEVAELIAFSEEQDLDPNSKSAQLLFLDKQIRSDTVRYERLQDADTPSEAVAVLAAEREPEERGHQSEVARILFREHTR